MVFNRFSELCNNRKLNAWNHTFVVIVHGQYNKQSFENYFTISKSSSEITQFSEGENVQRFQKWRVVHQSFHSLLSLIKKDTAKSGYVGKNTIVLHDEKLSWSDFPALLKICWKKDFLLFIAWTSSPMQIQTKSVIFMVML